MACVSRSNTGFVAGGIVLLVLGILPLLVVTTMIYLTTANQRWSGRFFTIQLLAMALYGAGVAMTALGATQKEDE